MSQETLASTDTRINDFMHFREKHGLCSTFSSAQSKRLGI